ncbi:MAG: dTDP-glucose 4,6-dehydratase [Corynebacterium sp.]|nr:dTDP-glucose 4,6-dehydratase [Corynebacterium sp.]
MTKEPQLREFSRILITGGAGFIGSNFVHALVDGKFEGSSGVSLLVYDSMSYAANRDNLPAGVELVVGDVASPLFAETLDSFRPDVVVHFAAESHVDVSISSPELFMRSNVEGTMHVAKACADRGIYLHHISTDEVYGDLEIGSGEMFDLSSPYNPSSPYAASKASSDYCVQAAIRTYGLKATISNCTNNFGPRQHVEKLIPRQILRALHGEPILLYGEGLNERDWIHVDDHNSAVWQILRCGSFGSKYLISARNVRHNKDIVDFICESIPGTEIQYITDRPGHDKRYALDPSSVEALGWAPQYNLESGLRETIAWYKEHQEQLESAYQESEARYANRGGK